MTQPREDDTDSQQESQGTSESRPPEHESMSPGPEQADDETATVDEVEDESAGGPVSQDQDTDSASADPAEDGAGTDDEETADTGDAAQDDAHADDEETADTDDSSSKAPDTGEPDTPSKKRRRGSGSSRRHRRPLGQTVARGVGILTSVALAAAVGGVAWWEHAAPTTPTPQLQALSLAQPGGATTYVCPHAPTNTLRGTDVGAMDSTTAIVPAKGTGAAQSATYAGRSVPTDTVTSMNSAEGGILALVPADGRVANAVGSVTTLTKSGDLRGLTAAPCTQPAAMSWIVGGSIAAGSSAELRLTNPGVTPATAKVTLYGSIGRLSLPSNGEVTVPAGGSSSLALETKGSQDPRIAVSVEADGGSVVPALVTESLDGETPAGTDVITPGAAPATDLVIPGVEIVEPASQGEVPQAKTGADSSDTPAVRIVNPGQAPATVSVTMLGKDGARSLSGAQSVTIDAGSVFDIQLAGVPAGTYGVQVTSSTPVGAAVRMVRSGGEYPARSKALVHDQAWAQAALPGAADSGLLAVPRSASLSSAVTVANSGAATSVTLSSLDGSWRQDVKVAKGSSVVVEVPAKVAAVRLNSAGQEDSSGASRTSSGLAAATIVTAQAGGDLAGTLISTVPAQPDAAVQAQRRILLD
ncbi:MULTISPECIES: DUF5719 family protein [Actinomyces]|uniref:Prevent-host-death protein n=1 Tax=Actinomyces oris TaxID=544580 RepID=A0A1Q8VSI9_9ACTO|nr:DUF5719 family protein [Actinomyces oris]OLO51072.1 hypothetical protein BKH28_01145 [Actinomyces oris]